jgi:transcriptional regulator with XRE-family HTH domain
MAFGQVLCELRLATGLSQGRLAEELNKVSGHATLTREEVSRWERGGRMPGRFWLPHLSAVLHVPLARLEAVKAGRAVAQPLSDCYSVAAGHAGCLPQVTGIDEVNRRELLRIISMAGAVMAGGAVPGEIDWGRLDYFADRIGGVDAQTVDEFGVLNGHLWRAFVLARTKQAMFPAVRDQLDVVTSSLGQTGSPVLHRRLCELASSLFQLSGEILFDLNQYTEAAQCYTLAATASREAGAPDLWACALTRHAFIGIYDGRYRESAPMLEAAAGLARRGDGALSTRHWVAVVHAQAFAGLGDLESCQRALDTAGQVLALREGSQNGGWLRFDGSRLAEERGTCYVQLDRPDLAEAALDDALRQDLSARRRGSVLADLAVLGARRRDIDALLAHAGAAVELARQSRSGVIFRRLRTLRPHLSPFLADGRVRELRRVLAAEEITA